MTAKLRLPWTDAQDAELLRISRYAESVSAAIPLYVSATGDTQHGEQAVRSRISLLQSRAVGGELTFLQSLQQIATRLKQAKCDEAQAREELRALLDK